MAKFYGSQDNPKGLFVTPSFDTAKQFGVVVIEFHAPVSQLEAPVWPNGMYTVQGEMSGSFEGENGREQARNRLRDELKNSPETPHWVKDSDRVDLGNTLLYMGRESQALFVGELNPNSIRAVWHNDTNHIKKSYIRYSPKQFLAKIEKDEIQN